MAKRSLGASSPVLTTAFTQFFSCNPSQDCLFAVNAGISLEDALEQASTFLASADSIMHEAANRGGEPTVWAAAHLVEISKALVDASISALVKQTSDGEV